VSSARRRPVTPARTARSTALRPADGKGIGGHLARRCFGSGGACPQAPRASGVTKSAKAAITNFLIKTLFCCGAEVHRRSRTAPPPLPGTRCTYSRRRRRYLRLGRSAPCGTLLFGAKGLFIAAMVTTDGCQELRRRLIWWLAVQLGGAREIIRRKRPQRLSSAHRENRVTVPPTKRGRALMSWPRVLTPPCLHAATTLAAKRIRCSQPADRRLTDVEAPRHVGLRCRSHGWSGGTY
jgi:hypothetical protein